MVAEVGKYYAPGEQKERVLIVTNPNGEAKTYSLSEAQKMGFNPKNLPEGSSVYSYQDAEGNTKLTKDITDLPMSIRLNEETGDIEITAPNSIYNSAEFAQTFDEETLKKYSQAYKLNPDYKLTVMEKNEETGGLEEKEVSIPEYIEKLNESLENFRQGLKQAVNYRNQLYSQYGDKALNMNLAQITMSLQYDGDAIYFPDLLAHVSSFGPKGNNPFKEILDKVSEDGVISVEDLKKIYNIDNFGRDEMAGLLAVIDGSLKGSNWSKEDTITYEDGEVAKNRNSATEAAKLIAFKNFLLSNNPHAEWWQQAGYQIESFTYNAAYGVTKVFGSLADMGEAVVTFGNGTMIHDAVKSMDDAMDYYNTNNAITYDALTNAQILGTLGGMALGTVAVAKAGAAAADKLMGLAGSLSAKATTTAYEALEGTEALANTTTSLVKTALMAEEVSVGTKIAIASMTVAEKIALATNVALTGISGVQTKHFITEFLFDTVHDALLYDFSTLRDVLIAVSEDPSNPNRQKIVDYWMKQLGENALFWIPFGAARSTLSGWKKVKTSTEIGKMIDVAVTKYVNKFASAFGKYKTDFKNSITGGNVIAKLKRQLSAAEEAGDLQKVNHIRNKIQIEIENVRIREARKSLGDLDLNLDGAKLTDETYQKFQQLLTDIKNAENTIDLYRLGTDAKRGEMLLSQKDPATGKQEFLYPELAGANVKASEWYEGLAKLNKKYNLDLADDGSQISQDVINYWKRSENLRRMEAFASSGSKNAASAQTAADNIRADLEHLEQVLPEEIKTYIIQGIDSKIYPTFYKSLNEYGYSGKYKVLNKELVQSYEANPIWQEVGYSPMKIKQDRVGKFISDDGTIDRIIDQEMDKLTFEYKIGQDYEDPELVRQIRINHMAEAKNSAEIRHLYSSNSNATFVQTVSGDETQLAGRIKEDVKTLEHRINTELQIFSKDSDVPAIELNITKTKSRKGLRNEIIEGDTKEAIVSSMSPSDTSEYLFLKGNLDSPTSKLTDRVTPENYDEWFNNRMNDSSRKYLVQQYQNYDPAYSVDDQGVRVKRVKIGDTDNVPLDAEIADRISELNKAGYRTYNSHSGISADHLSDSKAGGGYIQFDASLGKDKINKIKKAASKAGMDVTEDANNPLYGNTISVYQTNAADGTLHSAIVDEANQRMYKKFKVPKAEIESGNGWGWVWENLDGEKFKAATNYREEQIKKLYKTHGGYAQPDDATRSESWNKFFEALGISNKEYSGSYNILQKAVEKGGDDFESGLERAYLIGDKVFGESSAINEAARNLTNGRKAFEEGVLLTKVKGELRHIKNIDVDSFANNMYKQLDEWIDAYVERVLKDEGAKSALNTIAGVTDGGDEVARVLALKELQKPKNAKVVEGYIAEQIKPMYEKAGLDSVKDRNTIIENSKELFKGLVESKIDDSNLVAKTINSSLVDGEDIFDKVAEINKRIDSAKGEVGKTQIMYMDDDGRVAYAKVDPAFASLYDYRYRIERANAGILARINGLMSKAFRYGTTSVNLSSFGNQWFRDTGNAVMVGGAWSTIKTNADNLVDVFGRNIVEQIKQFEPDDFEIRQIEDLAERTGRTVEEAAVSRELMRGSARAPYTTERMLYKKFMKEAYGQTSDDLLKNMQSKLDKLVKKYNPEDLLNGKRENYLRNRVYASSLNDALKEGYTLQQARTYAEFAMNNATTNFSRQIYHMQAIADSTPYFRAAINGTKSFWRMWSIDPVGITGRIMGGLVIPTMALVGHSMSNEKDREVYANIPEYVKEDSIVFVFDGQPISIPIPHELSFVVAPFRQFVEHLAGTNQNDFWELMMNDLLGISPYESRGFTAIDFDAMVSDPTIFDRINRGTSRLFSQMAPVPIKSAYMLATGTDPYTGRSLRDTNYMYWNDETGSVEVMDYNSNAFAIWFASLFGENMTPDLAERVVSGVIGSTGSNLLGDITKTLQEGPLAGLQSAGANVIKQITNPISVNKYNLVDAIWKRAVKQLNAEKEALLSSEKMRTLNNELAQTKDPEKRKQILAERQTLVDEYQQRVGDMINRLETVYHGNFDRKKFAAVIALLNFNSDSAYQSGSMYSSTMASDQFWDGRDAAVHTMQQLGVKGTSDMSIFGYLAIDSNGNKVMKYSSPVAIMDMEAQWGNQSDMHLANIKALVSQNDLWDKHQEVKNQVNAIYAKDKLTSADYDLIDEIYINWNEEVMDVLAPYIERMTPEAAINNSAVLDYLDSLIELPGSFKKDSRGRTVSDKKLGNGSAKQAYIKNYIKYIFGVNDTGYSSGKNYSDRTNYDKETSSWK